MHKTIELPPWDAHIQSLHEQWKEKARAELRDEFAKAALIGLLAAGEHESHRAYYREELAEEAWAQADAMLRARVPRNPENTPLAQCSHASDALITSLAPEMLAALEDMVNLIHGILEAEPEFDDDGADCDRRLKKTIALIAKARGDG